MAVNVLPNEVIGRFLTDDQLMLLYIMYIRTCVASGHYPDHGHDLRGDGDLSEAHLPGQLPHLLLMLWVSIQQSSEFSSLSMRRVETLE